MTGLVVTGIGVVAAGLGSGLQISGLLVRPAAVLAGAHLLPPNEPAGFGYFLVLYLLGFSVAWTMTQVMGAVRQAGLFVILIAELVAAAWVLHAVQISFPLLPVLCVTIVSTLLGLALNATETGRRRRSTVRAFTGRLGQQGVDRLTESDPLALAEPNAREASSVFCEIANEAQLIDDLPASTCAQLTAEFIDCARRCFLREGGYLIKTPDPTDGRATQVEATPAAGASQPERSITSYGLGCGGGRELLQRLVRGGVGMQGDG